MYNKLFIIQICNGYYNPRNKTINLHSNNIINEHEFLEPNTKNLPLVYRTELREFIKLYNNAINGAKLVIKKINLEFIIDNVIWKAPNNGTSSHYQFKVNDISTTYSDLPKTHNISLNNEILHIYLNVENDQCMNDIYYDQSNDSASGYEPNNDNCLESNSGSDHEVEYNSNNEQDICTLNTCNDLNINCSDEIINHPYTKYNNIYHTINTINIPKKLHIGVLIPLSGILYSEGKLAKYALNYMKYEIMEIDKNIEFNFIFTDTNSDNNLCEILKKLHRDDNIDIFIYGPVDNNMIKFADPYIKANNLLLLTFGPSLKNEYISENILSLSPVMEIHVDAIVSYMKYINKTTKKYIIPCYINNIYGTDLFNSVKKKLHGIDKIELEIPIVYNLDDMNHENMLFDIKNKIKSLLNKNINSSQIYLYFISSYEIINFITYVIKNDTDNILESINWIGTDSNYLIFNSYLNNILNFNINSLISLNRIKEFMNTVNFICLAHDYDDNQNNNRIIRDIGYNPCTLGIADCFWLLAHSFLITKSANKKQLRNTIKVISSKRVGLTGDLSLNCNGSRSYNKYAITKAFLCIEDFKWEKIGTYDDMGGLVMD